MAKPRALKREITIHGIASRHQPIVRAELTGHLPGGVQQWPYDAAIAVRHGGNSCDARAAKYVQQDCFRPVIHCVADRDAVRAYLRSNPFQGEATYRSRCGFNRDTAVRRVLSGTRMLDVEGNVQPVALPGDIRHILIRLSSSKTVVNVGDGNGRVELGGQRVDCVEHGQRVLAARHSQKNVRAGRYQAVLHDGAVYDLNEGVGHAGYYQVSREQMSSTTREVLQHAWPTSSRGRP